MNRSIVTNFQPLSPEQLPPSVSERGFRALFIHSNALGFATQSRQIKLYAGRRDDIDAVHLDLVRPLWAKIFAKTLPLPGGMDRATWRLARVFRTLLNHWLDQPMLRGRFDVVHITTQGAAASILDHKNSLGGKWSIYADCTARLGVRDFGNWPSAMRSMASLEDRMFAAADLLVCMNQITVESMQRDYAAEPGKIFLSRGCVPVLDHPPVQAPAPMPRILFVGNDWKRKGGPELLRLHQEKFADRCELHTVGGNIPIEPSAQNVVWHGKVEHERLLREIFPICDLLVLPTKMDVSPWVVVEAASNGLPVIATRMGAIGEIVVDQKTGVLCEVGDWPAVGAALDRLLNDPPLRQSMGRAALAHMREHFDPDRTYNGLLDRLRALAGK
jgi:glycosyltransferase involved in cell wall biosynthesis